jgi:hypothetical protein
MVNLDGSPVTAFGDAEHVSHQGHPVELLQPAAASASRCHRRRSATGG